MSQFDESKIRRDAEGKFATKGPSAEDTSVQLADPGAGDAQDMIPFNDYGEVDKEKRTEEMLADLHRDIGEIVNSGQVEKYLDAINSNGLRKWSLNNRHLALAQLAMRKNPKDWGEFADMANNAHMMGFKQWKEKDASVKKGEKGIWILAPMTKTFKKENEKGEEEKRTIVTGFRAVPVFDVSQCEGPGTEMPEHPSKMVTGEVPPGTVSGLRSRIEKTGYSYSEKEIPEFDPATGKGPLGYTDPQSKEVVVDSRLSPAQKASTMAHELGHIKCGHCEPDKHAEYRVHRGEMEAEAETAAYMILRGRGMDAEKMKSFSPGYIAVWAQGDNEKITRAMNKGVKASAEVLDGDWPEND